MNEEPYLNDGDLKPCPFCGGEPDVSEGTQGPELRSWWYVECISCGASVDSVEGWNKRQLPQLCESCGARLTASGVCPPCADNRRHASGGG